MRSSRTVIAASVGAVVLGLGVFLGIRYFDEVRHDEAVALKNESNALACETYMKFSYVNFKDNMSLADYKQNHQEIQVLALLGGDAQFVSLLNKISREYELLFDGEDGEPILAMGELNNWCEPYLGNPEVE